MKINFTYIFLIVFMIFVINRQIGRNNTAYEMNTNMYANTEIEKNNGDIDKKPVESFKESIKSTFKKLNNLSPIKVKTLSDDKEPIRVVRNNYEEVLDTSKFGENKDFISPNPQGTTEYRFIDENMKTAWSNTNVSQHPKHYTSDVEDEKTNISDFFDKSQFYHDNTSPNSSTSLPERCSVGPNNEVYCNFNNKLQLIPPKLIQDSETNGVLNSIGSGIYKSVESTNIDTISENNYSVWEYENEKSINGGVYYGNVYGSTPNNEEYMELNSIKSNYSF